MKRKLTSLIATTAILGAIIAPSQSLADDQKPITVYVDGQQLKFEVSPVIKDGSTLVPLRALFEKFGMKVSWDSSNQTITGTKDGLSVQMQIGNTNATVNGKSVMLEVPPSIIDGSTLVPLRFIGEASGNEIAWDGANRSIVVKSKAISKVKEVTRAEVSRFLVRSLGLFDDKAKANLADVSSDNEYFKDISSALENNIMLPYEDGTFKPSALITRVEYAAILAKALSLPTSPSNSNENVKIKDFNKVPAWATNIVQAVINSGLMDLNEDGTFNGNSPLEIGIDEPNIKLKQIKEKNSAGVIKSTKSSAEKDELSKVNNDYSYFKSAFKAGERQLTQDNFILTTAYYDGALSEDNFFKYWDGLSEDTKKSFMLQYTKELQSINPKYTIRVDFYFKKGGIDLGTCSINVNNGFQGVGVVPNPRGLQNGIK